MKASERLDELFEKNNGIVKTAQALEIGVSKPALYAYVKEYNMEQIAHGVYIKLDAWADPMYLIHLRSPQIVFSHDCALYLHNLAEREPLKYTVTVKTGYNPSVLKADGIKVYTVKKELYGVGIETAKTIFGNEVPVYNMERTICDIVRSRSGMELQTFQSALKEYMSRRDKDLSRLMEYAEMFHVERILRQYLFVLL